MEFSISQPKVVWLPRNEKQTYPLKSRPQMWPIGLTLTITLTFEFWRSNMTLTFDHTHDLDHGFSWSNFLNSCISEWEGRLTLYKGGGSRSFMTMTMTIWWPRSGVWIYQIVTGVTSVVGVPSTHLIIPPKTKFRGGILDSPCSSVRLSVCLSVRPSIRPSVRPSVRGSVSGW